MTRATEARTPTVTPSAIRLAKALVRDAAKRGEREDARIEKVASTALPQHRS